MRLAASLARWLGTPGWMIEMTAPTVAMTGSANCHAASPRGLTNLLPRSGGHHSRGTPRNQIVSHDVVQRVAFTVIPEMSGLVLHRGLPVA